MVASAAFTLFASLSAEARRLFKVSRRSDSSPSAAFIVSQVGFIARECSSIIRISKWAFYGEAFPYGGNGSDRIRIDGLQARIGALRADQKSFKA